MHSPKNVLCIVVAKRWRLFKLWEYFFVSLRRTFNVIIFYDFLLKFLCLCALLIRLMEAIVEIWTKVFWSMLMNGKDFCIKKIALRNQFRDAFKSLDSWTGDNKNKMKICRGCKKQLNVDLFFVDWWIFLFTDTIFLKIKSGHRICNHKLITFKLHLANK